MEIVVFVIGALLVAIYLVRRVRRGESSTKERFIEGLPHDLRDKDYPAP
ncbi:MAG: hypothetical protein AB1736_11895 [Chloroflexota bacterium]